MSRHEGMTVDFQFANAAKSEIANLRKQWNKQFSEPAEVAVVGWGTTVLTSWRHSDGVVVSFYGRNERHHIEHGVERVAGMDVVFFITEPDYRRFGGRTIDFSADRGFHLRA